MTRIPQIQETKYNHGDPSSIVMTCTVPVEIGFDPNDIVRLLDSMDSVSMAKIVNAMGHAFNKDEMAECYSVEDLNDDGRQFIDSLHYFIHANEADA